MTGRIVKWAILFATVAALAAVAPRLAGRSADGMSAGATAALTFVALALVAAAIAIHLVVIVVRHRRECPPVVTLVGVLPLIVTLLALGWLWSFVLV